MIRPRSSRGWLRGARDAEYARSIVETVPSALVVLDARLRVISANEAFQAVFGLSGEVAQGHGDPNRLLQVVNNLLTNAIKFTPRGGRVSVRLERVGDQAQLTVTDTGIGMRPEVVPQIFSRFVQADSAMTRSHGGLDLGLSIVRHLVEVHGGKVQAESPGEGRGSTFRVTLPLGRAGVARPSGGPPRSTARDIQGVRVLLVEDEEDTREAYATMLAELGGRGARSGLVRRRSGGARGVPAAGRPVGHRHARRGRLRLRGEDAALSAGAGWAGARRRDLGAGERRGQGARAAGGLPAPRRQARRRVAACHRGRHARGLGAPGRARGPRPRRLTVASFGPAC